MTSRQRTSFLNTLKKAANVKYTSKNVDQLRKKLKIMHNIYEQKSPYSWFPRWLIKDFKTYLNMSVDDLFIWFFIHCEYYPMLSTDLYFSALHDVLHIGGASVLNLKAIVKHDRFLNQQVNVRGGQFVFINSCPNHSSSRGGFIGLIIAACAAIAAAVSSAGAAVIAGATTVATAIASSTVATAVVSGAITTGAGIAIEEGFKAIKNA